ncbi:pimeloyl-ACP methyl ester carboxylesterase [Streptomyces sp. PvR006]|uniref:alpha/beta hydrolase n=1 Tax=Streptomyces sp. PvR006 TaxID=2817860 RepID=UPI001AEA003E|nr:alpha/beta hydrolase [Streptomyces sp. PvR006]MBP2585868.1 pimeloyl-ACP methyl ester carboxylesterase [Streptomyces sp. PvR006]
MYPMAPLIRTALNVTARVAPGAAGRWSFRLFVRPLGRARLRPEERVLFATARTGRLQVRGKDVVTYAWGDGRRPVLLVHGWSSRASRLTAFAEALLERGYSPVAFDVPGHGESPGRDSNIAEYREIVRQLHARHGDFDAVVAHSFGVLASLFALRDGVRTARFVGIGGVGSFDLLVKGFQGVLGVDDRVLRCMRDHVERRLVPGEPGVWDRFGADHDAGELGAPVLLFHDDGDDMVPLVHSRRLARAHGDRARLVVTQGLGHRRILRDPGVVDEAVEFLTAPAGEPSEGERVVAG